MSRADRVSLEDLARVRKLVEGVRRTAAQERLRNVSIPFSAIEAFVRSSFETNAFFPPDIRPEDLGDGAVIERLSGHFFRVHERFEIGQLRYSELSSKSYLFLRGAVLRYLKHYGTLLRMDNVHIDTRS